MVVDRLGKGGVHHYALGLAGALVGEGAHVTLLTTTPREDLPAPEGVDVRRRLSWADSDTRTTALLREFLNLAMTVWVALITRSRVVVIQLAYPAMTDRWAVLALRALRRRVVLTCHNLGWHEREGRIQAHGLTAYRRADVVVTLSDAERARLVDADPALAERSVTIPHGDLGFMAGAKLPQGTARSHLGLPESGSLLLFFGYLKEYKGADVLLEAVALLRDRGRPVPVVFAGQAEADAAAALEEQVRRLGIAPLVTLHRGYVAAADTAAYFCAADAVVLPYRHATQSGVVQLAYAYGRPVVVTEVGGLAEDVSAGTTGEIARPGDPAGLADAIERLVDDAEHLASVKRALAAGPPERNSWRNVAAAYLRLAHGGEGAVTDDLPVLVWATDVHWDGLWYGAQHLASRLSTRDFRVLFCEVPVSVLSPLRDRSRLRQLRHRFRRLSGTLAVDAPLGIPPQDHPRLRGTNSRVHARRIRRVLRRVGWADPAVIVGRYPYSWRLARHFPRARFVANLSDATWSQDPADAREMTARLDTADAAVCVSPPLVERARDAGVTRTLLLPQGVDADAVGRAAERGPDPAVTSVGRPVVGCLGNITPRTDFALIARLAAARPGWQFVLVGASGPLFRDLDDAGSVTLPENVHRLPPCAPSEVGSVVAAFDLAWVPYVWSDFNVASNPLKAWEYLAAGVPVVAPAFPALAAMGSVATLLGADATDSDWLAAMEAALANDDDNEREARRAFAAANTWDARADTLAGFLSALVPAGLDTDPAI